MNNGIYSQDTYAKIGFESNLPLSLTGPPNVVQMPYHFPPNNGWKNNTQQYLILVYDTSKQNNTTISIPYGVQGTTNFLIDWGDGTTEQILWLDNGNSRSTFHTYSAHGIYTVIISGALGRLGRANAIAIPSLVKCVSFGNLPLVNIASFFQTTDIIEVPEILPSGITDIRSLFTSCVNFNDPKIKSWNTSNITTINSIFNNARSFNQDLGSWNTANIRDMASAFEFARNFNNGNSSSINNWDTSSVTNMNGMFNGATSFNQPLSNWNVRKVLSFASMFINATSFNGSLSGWAPGADTVGTVCSNMFNGASNFTGIGLETWDTSQVTNMFRMFNGVSATGFNPNLGGWNTSKVTTMFEMFKGVSNFTGSGLGSWNTSSVTIMNNMFASTKFNENIASWNTSNVTDMFGMFGGDGHPFNQNISSWDTSKVTTMGRMFRGNPVFNQPIGSWNVSNVNDMELMFGGLGGWRTSFSQDLSSWDIRKVTTMATFYQDRDWGTTNYSNALIAWANLPDTNLNSQAITAFAASTTNTLVTSNNHGLVTGSRVNISGTTDYDGNYNVVSAPSVNTFVIPITFVANNATGTMNHRRSRNVVAGFGTSKYSAGAAATARSVLINTYGWTITDGGLA